MEGEVLSNSWQYDNINLFLWHFDFFFSIRYFFKEIFKIHNGFSHDFGVDDVRIVPYYQKEYVFSMDIELFVCWVENVDCLG